MESQLAAAIRKYPGYTRVLGWLLVLLVVLFLGTKLSREIDRPTNNFPSYFTAAHLVVEGQAIAKFYDQEWFGAQVDRFVPDMREIYHANVPTTALFLTPLAIFDDHLTARRVWILLMIPLLLLLTEATARLGGIGPIGKPYWYAAALFAQPVQFNLIHGQVYILVALGLVLVLKFWMSGRSRAAGAMLAVLFAFKSAGLMLWPLAAATGRWSLVWAGAAVLAIIIAATWPLIGPEGWAAYWEAGRDLWTSPTLRSTSFQSLPGMVRHLFSAQPGFGLPVVGLSAQLVQGLAIGLVLAFLGLTAVAARHNPENRLVVAAAILLTVICVPVSLVYAYTIVLVPIALLVRQLRDNLFERNGLLLWLGAAMILLPSPFLSPRLHDGWASLIAYPKLYGALLLWALCLYLLVQPRKASQPAEGT